MVLIEITLSCLTIIEFLNLIIRIIKITPYKEPEATLSSSDLTEEMRAKIYS